MTTARRRARLVVALAGLILVVAIVVSELDGGGLPQPPAATVADSAGPGDPFAYRSRQEADFVARAGAGNARPLFVLSPGGAVATAAPRRRLSRRDRPGHRRLRDRPEPASRASSSWRAPGAPR